MDNNVKYIVELVISELKALSLESSECNLPALKRILNHVSYLTNIFGEECIGGVDDDENVACTSFLNTPMRQYQINLKKQIRDIEFPPTNRTVVIINGAGGVGKDTIVDIAETHLRINHPEISVKNISSVDKVKQAAHLLGWDGDKNEKGRNFLHQLKMLSVDTYNGVEKYVMNRVDQLPESSIAFIHIREPKEIESTLTKLKALPNMKAITLLVTSSRGVTFSNGADDVVSNYTYDKNIDNNGTISELEPLVIKFIESVI